MVHEGIKTEQQQKQQAAQQAGGSVRVTFDPHCTSYIVDEREPLLQLYRAVLAKRGAQLSGLDLIGPCSPSETPEWAWGAEWRS